MQGGVEVLKTVSKGHASWLSLPTRPSKVCASWQCLPAGNSRIVLASQLANHYITDISMVGPRMMCSQVWH